MLHDNKAGATLHVALGIWQSLYSAKHRVCAAQESAPTRQSSECWGQAQRIEKYR